MYQCYENMKKYKLLTPQSYFSSAISKKDIAIIILALCVLSTYLYVRALKSKDGLEEQKSVTKNSQVNRESDIINTVAKTPRQLNYNLEDILSLEASKRLQIQLSKHENRKVKNLKKYGPLVAGNLVIVIDLRSRTADHLMYLLSSLKFASGIMQTLLIFCHLYFDTRVNKVIEDINYVRVLQIFYPYSDQLYPKQFPGPDVYYCPTSLRCENIDVRGDRHANFAQVKHFWWWKVNTVFDHVEVTKDYKGTVVFLEEDDYVAEDIIYITRLLEKTAAQNCSECMFLNLNARLPKASQYEDKDKYANIETLKFSSFTTGLAFNRSTWEKIKSHKEIFCKFNDYTWYNSLAHLVSSIGNGRNNVLFTEGPRIFKMRMLAFVYIDDFIHKVRSKFYPNEFKVQLRDKVKRTSPRRYWEDLRDQELCMIMF